MIVNYPLVARYSRVWIKNSERFYWTYYIYIIIRSDVSGECKHHFCITEALQFGQDDVWNCVLGCQTVGIFMIAVCGKLRLSIRFKVGSDECGGRFI